MRRQGCREGCNRVNCGQALASARAPEVTFGVAAKMTKFKSEMTWALRGFVSSLQEHVHFLSLASPPPLLIVFQCLRLVCTFWSQRWPQRPPTRWTCHWRGEVIIGVVAAPHKLVWPNEPPPFLAPSLPRLPGHLPCPMNTHKKWRGKLYSSEHNTDHCVRIWLCWWEKSTRGVDGPFLQYFSKFSLLTTSPKFPGKKMAYQDQSLWKWEVILCTLEVENHFP